MNSVSHCGSPVDVARGAVLVADVVVIRDDDDCEEVVVGEVMPDVDSDVVAETVFEVDVVADIVVDIDVVIDVDVVVDVVPVTVIELDIDREADIADEVEDGVYVGSIVPLYSRAFHVPVMEKVLPMVDFR